MSFQEGDQVCLKSGGPVMTVEQEAEFAGATRVSCVWFEHNGKKQSVVREKFFPGTLETYQEIDLDTD